MITSLIISRRLQNEMMGIQDEVKQLHQDKGDMMEKHAREMGDHESQLISLKQHISELQAMVSMYAGFVQATSLHPVSGNLYSKN